MKARIERIIIVRKIDDCPHDKLQELEESGHPEDKALIDSYNEDWVYIGIYAEAEVSYPINPMGHKRLEWLKSSGLWGIESNSDEEYLEDIEREQLDNLREHLEVFNIDVSNIDSFNREKLGDGFNWS